MSEKVSIIIPVYNVEEYLKKCIDSLLAQTFKDIKIILVDDGSTDSSSKICDEYNRKDKRVLVIHKRMRAYQKREIQALNMRMENMLCLLILMTGWMRLRLAAMLK